MGSSCAGSPLIEGCSPIKSVFDPSSQVCRDSAQYRTAIQFSIEHLDEEKENSPPTHISSPHGSLVVQLHNLDTSFPDAHTMEPLTTVQSLICKETEDDLKDNDTVEMVDPVEFEDHHFWAKAVRVTDNTPATSFFTGNTFSVESTHMCMSPLAESSAIPCDSSIQVRTFVL